MLIKKLIPVFSVLGLALAATGCVIVDGTSVPGQTRGGDRQPVIHAFDYSPKGTIGKDDALTFTTVAVDPEGQPLQYAWSSTRGTLTANSGQTVAWRPVKPDGSLDPGLATVMLMVSDGRMTSTASANILIAPDGTATVQSSTASPAPQASAGPTSAPTPTASPEPSQEPAASPAEEPAASPAQEPTATDTAA